MKSRLLILELLAVFGATEIKIPKIITTRVKTKKKNMRHQNDAKFRKVVIRRARNIVKQPKGKESKF